MSSAPGTHWRAIAGDGAALILAVHFDAGTGGPGFADLAAHLDGCRPGPVGFRLFETLPPRSGGAFQRESEPVAYVGRWLAEIGSLGPPPVRAVLGYCAGSSLAGVLAARIAQAGLGEPALVLLAPERVDAAVLAAEFISATDSLAARLTPGELAEVRRATDEARDQAVKAGGRTDEAHGPRDQADEARGGAETSLAPVAAALDGAYRAAVRAACGRLSVAPAVERQLCDRFARYLGYLVACSRAQADAQGPSPVILDRLPDGTSPLADPDAARRVANALP